MMDAESILNEIGDNVALWCAANGDNGDLAHVADTVAARRPGIISVAPADVAPMWTWLENIPLKIYSRFYLPPRGVRDTAISDLCANINHSSKQGASGAQIFVGKSDLTGFCRQLSGVRDDLFFNKDLSIGLNIDEIDAMDWEMVFGALRDVRASSVVLAHANNKSNDFVGRVYGALTSWNGDFDGDLHFSNIADYASLDAAWRLICAVQPNLREKARFFIS